MRSSVLRVALLLLSLLRGSLQGGVKATGNGGLGRFYLPSVMRGVGAGQPRPGQGPAGAKAGYGVPDGYGGALGGGYPQPGKQKPGYGGVGAGFPRARLPLGGYGATPGNGGYPGNGVQQGYPGGGATYPANRVQGGYSNGYGRGGNGYPGVGLAPAYGNGAQTPYGGQLEGPGTDPIAAKYGGAGQLPYNGQAQSAGVAGLPADYGAGRYGAAGDPSQFPYGLRPAGLGAEGKPGKYGQVMYGGQAAGPTGHGGNGNGLAYGAGDPQANGLLAGGFGPVGTGQVPGLAYGVLGVGPAAGGYGGKEAKYGLTGFLGNGYRGRCPPGKC